MSGWELFVIEMHIHMSRVVSQPLAAIWEERVAKSDSTTFFANSRSNGISRCCHV